jgi:GNAT superfamily N-acetyltransferase
METAFMENVEDYDPSYRIYSDVRRQFDFPDALQIEVHASDDDDVAAGTASLSATLIYGLRVDVFDCLSQDLLYAYELLTTNKQRIEELNLAQGGYEGFEAHQYLIIDRLAVDEQARGKGLGLRLMREAVSIFGGEHTQVIVQAAPQGEDITKKQIRSLIEYYKSDKYLMFEEVDSKNQLGWLVALGGGDHMEEGWGLEGAFFPDFDGVIENPGKRKQKSFRRSKAIALLRESE